MVRAQSQNRNATGGSRSKGGAKKMKDLHDLGISCSMQNASPSSKISSGKGKNRKEIITSSSGRKDSSPLRRSTRESPMKRSVASNSNLRKSERLENPSASTPLKKGRLERLVKKVDQNPTRKSERIDKSSATSSSGCKKYSNSSDSSGKKKGNEVKNEGECNSKNLNVRIPLMEKKRKQMTARSYRASSSSPPAKKVKNSDYSETPHECDSLVADSEPVLEGVGWCCQRKISEQNVELRKGELKEDAQCSSSCSKEDSVKALGIEADATLAGVDATQNVIKAVTSEYADNLGYSKCVDTSLKPILEKNSMKEPFHDVSQRLLDGDDDESVVCKKNTKDLIFKSKEISLPDRSNCTDTSRENKSSLVASTSSQQTHYLDPDMVLTPKENDKLAQDVHTEDVCLSTSLAKGENSEKCTKCVKLPRVQYVHAKDPCSCTAKRIKDVSFASLEVVDQTFASGVHKNDANPIEEDKAKGTLLSKAKDVSDGLEKPSCHVPPVCTTSVDRNIEKTSESPYFHTLGSSKKHVCSTVKESLAEIQTNCDPDVCALCSLPKTELLCHGKGCSTLYHLSCLDPPLPNAPPGIWLCISCIKKKIECGVYSVSIGIDSVWNFKEGEQNSKQYLVKYKGLAHAHNQWISETQMLQEAPSLLSKFNRNYQKNMIIRWKQEWTVPHRLLQKRLLMPQELADQFFEKLGNNFTKCYHEWYVKWNGLGYEDATWELESSQFLQTPEALVLMKDYEIRLKGKAAFDSSNADKALEFRRKPFHKLTRLPDDCPPGLDNDHLNSINKLFEFWHRNQNTLFIDDQERVIKSILFIMSLQSYACRPFLIICPSTSLSTWETEFHRLAPSINLIVYNGTKQVRQRIQNLEFYEDGGCIKFQVFVSHADAILEDFDKLECIGWEALLVDDCQNLKISKHLEFLKRLSTGFRLLLLSGLVKDKITEYLNLLSFLDCGIDKNSTFATAPDSNDVTDTLTLLKERLSHYVAYERKPDSSKFLEYWIPVCLSNVQLEQYCATLISSSMSLRSCSKDLVGALGDILISTRKCCDHPYLVDDNLQGSLTRDLPATEYLNVGVNACGKLQVLDKILQLVKDQELRAMILFQTIGRAGKISIGDILDDFLRQRFGAESYERVDRGLILSKKLAALNRFKDKTSGRFLFLIENRACLPSIKLSSVDVIIIYNSDWNPLNDLRSLQKISIESQNDQILIFRLYSSFTVEEKLLVLAKQDMLFDNKIENVNPSVCHSLLSWGASYLFRKLDELHQLDYSDKSIQDSSDTVFLINDVLELLSNLPAYVSCKCSMIVKAQRNGASYSKNIILVGEKGGATSLDNDPLNFWSNLLDARYHEWQYVSSQSRSHRSCRRVHCSEGPAIQPEPEHDEQRRNKEDNGHTIGRSLTKADIVQDSLLTKTVVAEVHSTSQQDDVPHVSPVNGGTTDDTHEIDFEVREKIRSAQRSLHLLLKPELSKLCEILKLPANVSDMAQRFLEYIMYNHHVNPEPEVILQAFKISLCWRAASFLKHQIDHEESLALAKKYLNFTCDEDQTSNVYSKLRILKKKFSQKDGTSRKQRESAPPSSGADITEEPVSKMSADSSGLNVSELEKGARNEDSEGHNDLEQLMLPEQEQDPGCATHADLHEHPGSRNDELIRNQINLINKICSRREADLCVKQNEEILDFYKHKEKMKMSLKKEHEKRIGPFLAMVNDSTERENNIRLSSENFDKKMAAFSKHMSVQYEKLKSMQSLAKDKEHQIKNHWLEEAKGGKLEAVNLVDFSNNIPLSDCGFTLEEFKVPDQDDSHDSLGIVTYDSNTTGSFQNEQTCNVLSGSNLVTTEQPSNNFEVVIASSPGVAGCFSGQHDTFSVDDVLRDLPLQVPFSVPFTDIIDVHMDTVALASELPIMDIVTNAVDDMPINCRIAATEKQGFDKNSETSCSRSCPQIMDQGEDMNNGDGVCLATSSTENQEPCINEHARTDNSPVFEGQGIGTSQDIPTSSSSDFLTFQDELLTNNISVSDYFDNPLPVVRVPMFAQREDSIAASVFEQGPSRQMSGSLQNDMPMSEPTILSSALVSQIVDQSILQNSHMRSQSSIGEGLTSVSRQPETFRYPLFPLIQLMPTQGLQPEPLKNELARIWMHEDRIGKMHDDMKLKLKLECKQEMLKVQKKYDMLLQYAESEYVQSKKTLATIYDKVFMNQVLAEEFRAKFVENQGGSSSSSQGQQRSLHHLLQASQAQFEQRAASSTSSMSRSLPVTCPSVAIPLPVTRPATAYFPPGTHPPAAIPLSMSRSLPVTCPSVAMPLPVTRPATANFPPGTHPPAAIPLPGTHPSAAIPLSVTRSTVANLAPSVAIPLPATWPSAAIPFPATRPSATIPLPVTHPAVANSPLATHPSSASPFPVTSPSAAQSNSFATLRLRAPSIPSGQTVRSPSSVFPSNLVRHHFGSMLPPRTNIQVRSETRAPAPHLQRFRANASLTSSSVVQINGTSQHNPLANIGSTAMGQVANTPNLQPCFLPVSGIGESVISNCVSVCQDVSSTSVGLPLNVGDIGIRTNQQSSFQLADLVPTIDRSSSNFPSTTPGLSQISAADVDRHRANSNVVCISDDES